MSIFHKYDIRGVYGTEFTDELAYKIGKAIVQKFNVKKIVVGRDHRLSSPALFENFTKGATEMGCDVLSIGSTATPILYHVCVEENFDIGIMITASHNPKEYNGIKVCTKDSQLITFDKGLDVVEQLVEEDHFTPSEVPGNLEEKDVLDDYVKYITKNFKPLKHTYTIAVDTGNGVAGPIVKKILDGIEGLDVTEMYYELDGNYPNHQANPLEAKNLKDISAMIKKKKAHFGFVFDGDADRCILMDNNGDVVNVDMLLCVIADEENKKSPGGTYYYDLRFSKIVKEHLEQLGCKAVMSEVGNAVYKEKLKYEGGFVAAELSGHVMFAENHGLDDGFYLMLKILNYVDDLEKPVADLVKPYKKYFQSEEINTKVENPDKILEHIKEVYKDKEILELDGVTVLDEHWWFNLRKSNTEPVVRMRVEANSKEQRDDKIKELKELLTHN